MLIQRLELSTGDATARTVWSSAMVEWVYVRLAADTVVVFGPAQHGRRVGIVVGGARDGDVLRAWIDGAWHVDTGDALNVSLRWFGAYCGLYTDLVEVPG